MNASLQAPDPHLVAADVARALAEDIGSGDVTADLLPDVSAQAYVICKQDAAEIAGRPWFDASFRALDADVQIDWNVAEGAHVVVGAVLCRLHGRSRALLSGERTALNFLQTLSATATITAHFVDAVRDTRAIILDTRKTLPGLRLAQKYAVRAGGGSNHRLGLYDAMMVKENHILAAGSLAVGELIPSIRDLGVRLGVHPNTVAKAYQNLEQRGLITARRGRGMEVTPEAPGLVKGQRIAILRERLRDLLRVALTAIDADELRRVVAEEINRLAGGQS